MPATPEQWIPSFEVNTTDAGPSGNDQRDATAIQLTTGNIVVLMVDNSDAGPGTLTGTDIIGQVYDPLGNPIGSEFVAAADFTTNDKGAPAAAALPDGGFVVVSESTNASGTSIRAHEWSTNASGTVASAAIRFIANDPGADVLGSPSVAATGGGDYTVAYERDDVSTGNVRLEFREVSGGSVGGPQTALSGSASLGGTTDVHVLSNGNRVFVYDFDRPDDAIAFRLFDAAGTPLTTASFVGDTGTNGEGDFNSTAVALAGGGFVIAWQNRDVDDDVQFQRYDNAGAAQGGVVTVNGGGASNVNQAPHLIALADGGFVVAFDSNDKSAIRAQRYDAAGAGVGIEFTLGDVTGNEFDAGGIGLADGRIFATFTDAGSNQNVRAAIFDPRDAPNDPVYAPVGQQVGTVGDDVFTATGDLVFGYDGDDTITDSGVDGTNLIFAGAGDDVVRIDSVTDGEDVDGGTGTDRLEGFDMANGTIYDLAAGTVSQGGNVLAAANFENVRGDDVNEFVFGDAGENVLEGEGGNDDLRGRDGNDVLRGGGGADRLRGGDGADILFGGTGGDILDGGTGVDFASYTDATAGIVLDILAPGVNTGFAAGDTFVGIENIVGTAFADTISGGNVANVISGRGGGDTILGRGGADVLRGEGGNDVLRGGDGLDTLEGGTGADILFGGAGGDLIIGGTGFDFASYNDTAAGMVLDILNPGTNAGDAAGDVLVQIENLIGSGGNDTIRGGNVANNISGRAGNDTIVGRGGADVLRGEGGADVINGGAGADVLTGGAAGDRFVYAAVSDSTAGIRDTITDFANAGAPGGDRLDLSAADADAIVGGNQAFTFIGTAAFTGAAGQVRYVTSGGNASVLADVNGDAAADLVIDLDGVTSMVAGDFVL